MRDVKVFLSKALRVTRKIETAIPWKQTGAASQNTHLVCAPTSQVGYKMTLPSYRHSLLQKAYMVEGSCASLEAQNVLMNYQYGSSNVPTI